MAVAADGGSVRDVAVVVVCPAGLRLVQQVNSPVANNVFFFFPLTYDSGVLIYATRAELMMQISHTHEQKKSCQG